jgi:hypothetical protein
MVEKDFNSLKLILVSGITYIESRSRDDAIGVSNGYGLDD